MVVARLTAQGEGDVRLLAGALQQLRAQLLGQERIGIAVIDQQFGKPRAVLDQRDRVVRAPRRPVLAELAAECARQGAADEAATAGDHDRSAAVELAVVAGHLCVELR